MQLPILRACVSVVNLFAYLILYSELSFSFLVSFLVDARGGAMRGCRHSGIRIVGEYFCHYHIKITD